MKLSKQKLKNIIKEEIKLLKEKTYRTETVSIEILRKDINDLIKVIQNSNINYLKDYIPELKRKKKK